MKKIFFTCCLLMIASGFAFADTVSIKHFVVKENPFAKDEIAIVEWYLQLYH
jgi:hypothetical protein